MTEKQPPIKFAELVAFNVAALRQSRGMTVAEAAKLAGVSPRTWTFFEHPAASTGAAIGGNLDSIAAAFGVSLASLLKIEPGRDYTVTAAGTRRWTEAPPPNPNLKKRLPKDNPFVFCECGCGRQIRLFNENGKKRRFALGHNPGPRPKETSHAAKQVRRGVRKS